MLSCPAIAEINYVFPLLAEPQIPINLKLKKYKAVSSTATVLLRRKFFYSSKLVLYFILHIALIFQHKQ